MYPSSTRFFVLAAVLASACLVAWLGMATPKVGPVVESAGSLTVSDAVGRLASVVRTVRAGKMDYGRDDAALATGMQATGRLPADWQLRDGNRFVLPSGTVLEVSSLFQTYRISLPLPPPGTCPALLVHDMGMYVARTSRGSWSVRDRGFGVFEAQAACRLGSAPLAWEFY